MFNWWKKYLLEIVRGYKRNGHWIFFGLFSRTTRRRGATRNPPTLKWTACTRRNPSDPITATPWPGTTPASPAAPGRPTSLLTVITTITTITCRRRTTRYRRTRWPPCSVSPTLWSRPEPEKATPITDQRPATTITAVLRRRRRTSCASCNRRRTTSGRRATSATSTRLSPTTTFGRNTWRPTASCTPSSEATSRKSSTTTSLELSVSHLPINQKVKENYCEANPFDWNPLSPHRMRNKD